MEISGMTRRQYYSHAGPGWDYRFTQPDYNWRTGQVESDQSKFPGRHVMSLAHIKVDGRRDWGIEHGTATVVNDSKTLTGAWIGGEGWKTIKDDFNLPDPERILDRACELAWGSVPECPSWISTGWEGTVLWDELIK